MRSIHNRLCSVSLPSQNNYANLSDATREYAIGKERRHRRKAFLCVYTQLAVLQSERRFQTSNAAPILFDTSASAARHAFVGEEETRSNAVPLLGWELMREFFSAYCGVPELMVVSSRKFQHESFAKDFQEVISSASALYVTT